MTSGIVKARGHAIEGRVVAAIEKASRQTGIDFGYLMAQAARESAFDSSARSGASSASGLYQFTQGTWLEMLERHGARHGLADVAARITRGADGKLTVADPERRKEILALRRDPEVAALMAAEYAKGNGAFLEKRLGRPVTATDLYFAHFLGPAGAARFLESHDGATARHAAEVLPEAARLNPGIFYDGRSARSVAGVYKKIHDTVAGPSADYASLASQPAPRPAAAAVEPDQPRQTVALAPEPSAPPKRPAAHGVPRVRPVAASPAPPAPPAPPPARIASLAPLDGVAPPPPEAPPAWVSADIASMPMPERGTTGVSMPMPPPPDIEEAARPLSKLWRSLFG